VKAPARVGLVGCGIIGKRYAQGARAFDSFEIVACSDLDPAAARALAAEQGIEAVSPDELFAEPSVDVILNLTPPTAHAPILLRGLAAGKHVYTEKPLAASVAEAAEVLAEAERRGLRVGCAPDTFLGSAYQAGQRLIEEGAIGEPLSATALMLFGAPEAWHPNADMFYRAGGGPLLDIAPYPLTAIAALLGPVAAATGFATTPVSERTLAVGPRLCERFAVEVPTLVTAALRLERGLFATLSRTSRSAIGIPVASASTRCSRRWPRAARTAPRGSSRCTCSTSPTQCCARPPKAAPSRSPNCDRRPLPRRFARRRSVRA
jgi:predicted dehydrogenase